MKVGPVQTCGSSAPSSGSSTRREYPSSPRPHPEAQSTAPPWGKAPKCPPREVRHSAHGCVASILFPRRRSRARAGIPPCALTSLVPCCSTPGMQSVSAHDPQQRPLPSASPFRGVGRGQEEPTFQSGAHFIIDTFESTVWPTALGGHVLGRQ